MITGIFGLPGAGKTYEAVRRVMHAADLGRQCFSVTPINHPNVELITFDEIIDPFLPPGLILCDEVHLVLSRRSSSKLDPRFYEKLSQTRKDGHDLIYTSQHESNVLPQLRQNTNWGWITQSWGRVNGHPYAFSSKCWEMWKLRRGKPVDKTFQLFDMRIAKAYDTTYAIEAREAVEGYDFEEDGEYDDESA